MNDDNKYDLAAENLINSLYEDPVEGWERTSQSKKVPIYGRQRLYQRI